MSKLVIAEKPMLARDIARVKTIIREQQLAGR